MSYKADVSSAIPSSKRIEELWVVCVGLYSLRTQTYFRLSLSGDKRQATAGDKRQPETSDSRK